MWNIENSYIPLYSLFGKVYLIVEGIKNGGVLLVLK